MTAIPTNQHLFWILLQTPIFYQNTFESNKNAKKSVRRAEAQQHLKEIVPKVYSREQTHKQTCYKRRL
jgi:hypothetical protein